MVPLDSRQARIARALLEGSAATSLEELAGALELTPRIVRYNLPWVEEFLRAGGLTLVRRRGVGVWVEGTHEERAAVRASLDTASGPAVVEVPDRKAWVVLELLDAAPDSLRLETLEASLGVSRPTIRRDVRAAEAWLEHHRLHVRRLPGVGVAIRGTEVDIRAGLLAILLEAVPPHVLAGYAGIAGGHERGPGASLTGLAPFVAELDLPTFRAVLETEVRDFDDRGLITASLYLAIVARRLRAGRTARLAGGRLRSLMDHPASATAARIASGMAAATGIVLAQSDVAAITESLLGFVELADIGGLPDTRESRLIDRIVRAAAERLHPSLAEDQQLRESLTEHLRRLRVRLRYGLPVNNPLQEEVRARYPDVYLVAADVLRDVGPVGGVAIPSDEVGFLTMYLAGSLERHRLRPKIRVTVVCPAGMATAWILVSRLLAEFPQVEVARVISKTAFELEPGDDPTTDIIVSTVPLERDEHLGTSLVVSPLLRERDVRRLSRLLGAPAH